MSDDRCWCSCNKTVGTRLIPLNRQKHFIKEQLQMYLLLQKFVFVFGVCRTLPLSLTLSWVVHACTHTPTTTPSHSACSPFDIPHQRLRIITSFTAGWSWTNKLFCSGVCSKQGDCQNSFFSYCNLYPEEDWECVCVFERERERKNERDKIFFIVREMEKNREGLR